MDRSLRQRDISTTCPRHRVPDSYPVQVSVELIDIIRRQVSPPINIPARTYMRERSLVMFHRSSRKAKHRYPLFPPIQKLRCNTFFTSIIPISIYRFTDFSDVNRRTSLQSIIHLFSNSLLDDTQTLIQFIGISSIDYMIKSPLAFHYFDAGANIIHSLLDSEPHFQ